MQHLSHGGSIAMAKHPAPHPHPWPRQSGGGCAGGISATERRPLWASHKRQSSGAGPPGGHWIIVWFGCQVIRCQRMQHGPGILHVSKIDYFLSVFRRWSLTNRESELEAVTPKLLQILKLRLWSVDVVMKQLASSDVRSPVYRAFRRPCKVTTMFTIRAPLQLTMMVYRRTLRRRLSIYRICN